jgi:hypothetical protein
MGSPLIYTARTVSVNLKRRIERISGQATKNRRAWLFLVGMGLFIPLYIDD